MRLTLALTRVSAGQQGENRPALAAGSSISPRCPQTRRECYLPPSPGFWRALQTGMAIVVAQDIVSVRPLSIAAFAVCAALGLGAHFSEVFEGSNRRLLDIGFAIELAYFPKPAH